MEASVKWVEGLTFLGKGETSHFVVMDTLPEKGGNGAGSTPMELVLMAIGGCSGMDVVSILKKKRVKLDGFEIVLHGERAAEHPKIFTRVTIEYVFYGDNLPEKALEDAVRLSQDKYCSVSAMIGKAAAVDYKITVRPSDRAGESEPQ